MNDPILGKPGARRTSCPLGPSVSFCATAGLFISDAPMTYGMMYCPGTGLPALIAARTASSLESFLYSELWYFRTMWISELTTNTSTADSTIGSHSCASDTMATSGWRVGPLCRMRLGRKILEQLVGTSVDGFVQILGIAVQLVAADTAPH